MKTVFSCLLLLGLGLAVVPLSFTRYILFIVLLIIYGLVKYAQGYDDAIDDCDDL
jgi:hypothetical protein